MPVTIITSRPKVFLVGMTTPQWLGVDRYLLHRKVQWNTDPISFENAETAANDPMAVVEMAGRVCYHSWDNPKRRTRMEYIAEQIIGHEHGSVLEHVWFNFLVADLPRSAQLELVRHGDGTGFSFESQRFTDKHLRFVVPPRLRDDPAAVAIFTEACELDAGLYANLCDLATSDADEGTLKRKRSKEAARAVLPNAAGSDGMVSMNGRAARHIINMRSNRHADLSIREFAIAVAEVLMDVAPALFVDATVHVDDESGIPEIAFKYPKV